jgi:RNA polymerase sigma factor (TIGR02999 family)
MSDVTILLKRAASDDRSAIDELFALLYDDLYRMARARLSNNRPMTLLDTTSLAHEAYLRLRNAQRIDIENRAHFLAYVAQVLRGIVVDFARRRSAARRGGSHLHVSLDTSVADALPDDADSEVEKINDVLEVLEKADPRLKKVVEMRYFGGMTDAEIAEALGVTPRTVGRDWARARLLLSVELKY